MGESKDPQKDAHSKQAEENESNPQNEPKVNWKQVMGCLSATSLSFAGGISLSFTSSLFPALQAPESDIQTTAVQNAWIASCGSLCAPLGALISGFLMEHIGRLAALQLSVLPLCISWIVIATAHSFTAILLARIIIGAAYIIAISPAGVLITETALKSHRGALSSVGNSVASFGVLCGYVLGALLDWRTYAWAASVTPLISFVLACIFTAESPLWLRYRGRMKAAQRASLYYYNDPNYVVQAVIPRRSSVRAADGDPEKSEEDPNRPSYAKQLRWLLTLPSGLKPLIILTVIFLLQNFTGIFIIMVNSVPFFQEAGTAIDPYTASIMVGGVRFVASIVLIFLLRRCRRRLLMLVGTMLMAICIAASAYATSLTLAERDGGPKSFLPSWFAVACVVIYHLGAVIGPHTIPWTMSAELFPQRIRGAAQSINFVLSNIFLFSTLQSYPWMNTHMGGAVGLQYFFAAVSLLTAVFAWIFFPETHGRSLTEIEEYFVHNTVYLGHKKK